jgi:hypothetical protein
MIENQRIEETKQDYIVTSEYREEREEKGKNKAYIKNTS